MSGVWAGGVLQGRADRGGGQVDGRQPLVAGVAEALRGLAYADDDGGTRLEFLGQSRAPSSAMRCSHSAMICLVISAAGRIWVKDPTTWPMKNDSRRRPPSRPAA